MRNLDGELAISGLEDGIVHDRIEGMVEMFRAANLLRSVNSVSVPHDVGEYGCRNGSCLITL